MGIVHGRMRFERAVVASLGYELPPLVVSSSAIEDRLAPVYARLGLHHGRLELMTGIKERRAWPEGVRPSEVAMRAGRAALEKARLPKERIGCLVHASVCRDFLEPATANVVHHALGLPPAAHVFDVSNACLGVLNGVLLVANMIELGQIEAGLVVAGEIGAPLLEATLEALVGDPAPTRKSLKAAFASLTIGSGAAAVLLASQKIAPHGHALLGGVVRAATEHHALCRGGQAERAASGTRAEAHSRSEAQASWRGSASTHGRDTGVASGLGLAMETDSEALLLAGVALAKEAWIELERELGLSGAPFDRIVAHQVGRAHEKLLFETLGLEASRGYATYDRLGNVGSVSLPLSLALADEEGLLAKGNRIGLLGIGSGLSCAMLGVRW